MNYGFAKLNPDNTIALFDPDLDTGDTDWNSGLQWGHGMYRRWNYLRTVNPHLTTMIAIGGWNEGSDKYSKMASSAASRKTFVDSVVKFLQKYDFDGLDLDWEYPSMKAVGDQDRKPGNAADKQNFVDLIRELHTAFQPHGFVLSAATSAGKPTIDRAYNLPEMSKYLDIINLMTYDMHGAWENKTAHNAPLHPRPGDIELDKEFTIEYAVDYYLKLGADPKKIVLGMPLYGRTFTLKGTESGILADAVGAGGTAGPITRLPGTLGYNEICEYLKDGQWKVTREPIQKVPYAVKGNQWIGFDDVQSLKDKVAFLKSKGLGGGMVWSIDTDDFRGLCGHGKFPLLKAISGDLNGVTGPDPVIPETHLTGTPDPNKPTTQHGGKTTQHGGKTTQHSGKTTQKPDDGHTSTEPSNPDEKFTCHSTGWFKDPKDRAAFHECIDIGNGKIKDQIFHCGAGTVYDEVNHVCKMP